MEVWPLPQSVNVISITTIADPGKEYHAIMAIDAAAKLRKPRSKPATKRSIPGPGPVGIDEIRLVSKVGAGTVETM